jgi:hypothetical protein
MDLRTERRMADACEGMGRIKTMSKAMLLIKKATMRTVCVLLAAISFVIACAPRCDHREALLAANANGSSVVWKYECSSTESIELRSVSGRKTTFFKFQSSGGISGCDGKSFSRAADISPTAVWTDPNVIRISIGVIGRVDRQLSEVDGVRVTYDIGELVSESCKNTAQ